MSTNSQSYRHLQPHKHRYIDDMRCSYSQGGYASNISSPPEPVTCAQALKSDHCEEWKKAMMEEINSLLKNETWMSEKLLLVRTTVKNKWIFKIKVKSSGEIERLKARLVAKGFSQTYGMDYQETFAPTARSKSIRIVLSIAGANGFHLVQFDIKTAYLNAHIHEIILRIYLLGSKTNFIVGFHIVEGWCVGFEKGCMA